MLTWNEIRKIHTHLPQTSEGWEQHPQGGGWVKKTAKVASTVYVGPAALVFDEAEVSGFVQLYDRCRVYGHAKVSDNVRIMDNAQVFGSAHVSGNVSISEYARIRGSARITDFVRVGGTAHVCDSARISCCAEIRHVIRGADVVTKTPIHISGLRYNVTISDVFVTIGCTQYDKRQWLALTHEEIKELDSCALDFYARYKDILKALAEQHQG